MRFAKKVTFEDVIDFLDQIVEYMKDREDAEQFGDTFVPNEEMRLRMEADRLLEGKWDFIREDEK